jgi:SAM-dependent methyltransferase
MVTMEQVNDTATAEAFATSWNTLPSGSIYTFEQFEQWLSPHTVEAVRGKSVLELGCGNGSLLVHLARWQPSRIVGVDLGSSVISARENMQQTTFRNFDIVRADLQTFRGGPFDFVYSIGVLHHLKNPHAGFRRVIDNVRPGGWFHCSVYAHEGNALVRVAVEPLRRVSSRLPWWMTKYIIATPLAVPFFAYSKCAGALPLWFPLREYASSLSLREFAYFRHVAFDQLVTPQTAFFRKSTVEEWIHAEDRVIPESAYIQMRNGNSWRFGGQRRLSET